MHIAGVGSVLRVQAAVEHNTARHPAAVRATTITDYFFRLCRGPDWHHSPTGYCHHRGFRVAALSVGIIPVRPGDGGSHTLKASPRARGVPAQPACFGSLLRTRTRRGSTSSESERDEIPVRDDVAQQSS